MLEVELDVFSGVPNPHLGIVATPGGNSLRTAESRSKTDFLRNEAKYATRPRLSWPYCETYQDDNGPWDRALTARRAPFPNEFRLGIGASKKHSVADWLVKTAGPQGVQLNDQVREVVSLASCSCPACVVRSIRWTRSIPNGSRKPRLPQIHPTILKRNITRPRWACPSNLFSANAHFFNDLPM